IVATAAVAAVLASAGTVGVVRALDSNDAPAAVASVDDAARSAAKTVDPAPVTSTADRPDWQAVAEAVRPSVVAIQVSTGSGQGEGSGVVVDESGRILTNDHVVGDAREIAVTLMDGRVYGAELVGTDPTTDVAVIRLVDPPDDLVAASIGDSDSVAVGEPVMAVGNPLGLDSTVTTGIVSAVDRPVSTGSPTGGEPVVTNAIQVDAAINPGNSGGPLFDASGRVVGITSSILTTSRSSGSIGLGFAIPVNLAERVATELVQNGSAEHAFLGVTLGDGHGTADGATRVGAVVGQVGQDSPAAQAGLAKDDVVVALDGEAVSGAESLTAQVRERAPGDVVTLTVVRGGKTLELDVTLGTREQAVTLPSSSRG
ncbi:hypothetical protein N867_14965, partial [Actinotalea fermentans ATCC 43279 = JCM 9966 = DSM 3133]